MISTLRHRGPDADGVWTSGPVGLGHSRLSIIDVAGGSQPMSFDEGRLQITFNGEIFNYVELREHLIERGHRFATRSDTEVILAAYREYGDECLHHFNGQWALAIWDSARRRLFVSRDRMGVRPLFYARTAESFLFASEIKALLASDELLPELDLVALDQIFTFWVTLPPRTAFKGVQQLPPGHALVVEDGQTRSWQYWKPEYAPQVYSDISERRLTEEFLSLMLDATRLRLRSEVPVGAYLSGGIDSTFITALTKSLVGERLRTFSVSFADSEFDESPYQNDATKFLQTDHSGVHCTYDDIVRIFPEVIKHTEQPVIRTAPAPLFLLAKLVRDSGFKVVLTGEGADEVLGGYDIFKEAKIRRFWAQNLDSKWRPLLLKRLYPYIDGIQRQSPAYLKSFFSVSAGDLHSPFFSHLPRWRLTARLKAFFSEGVRASLQNYSALEELNDNLPQSYRIWSGFNQAEYLEAAYLLPGYILSSQGDRMAMAHSVEGRYPFLDHRVVQFAASLSPKMKMKVLDQKYILKSASAGLMPETIRKRAKQPYRAPDGKCFFAPSSRDYSRELLSRARIEKTGVFNSKAVDALVDKFSRGCAIGVKDNMALVGIISTQLLFDQFITNRGYIQPCS